MISNRKLADQNAEPGSVQHLVIRFGFMPVDESASIEILKALVTKRSDDELKLTYRMTDEDIKELHAYYELNIKKKKEDPIKVKEEVKK